MKRIFRKAIAILCILGMLTSCATYSTLLSVDTSYNEVYEQEDSSMQYVEDEDFLISAEGASIEDSIGAVVLTIGNKSNRDYRFHDDSVEILGGNYKKDKWKSLGRWDAREYYNYARQNGSSDGAPLLAFLFGMGVLGTVLDVYDDADYFDLGDALFTTWLISSSMSEAASENAYNLDWLEDNLLYSKTIYGREVYRGLVYFKAGDYPDYMIRLHLGNGEPYELVFQRSDREDYL